MNTDASQPTVIKAWDLVDRAKAEIDNLSADELGAELDNGNTVVVDIRDFRELYTKGKIPGAVHAPRGMLEFWIDPASEYYRERLRSVEAVRALLRRRWTLGVGGEGDEGHGLSERWPPRARFRRLGSGWTRGGGLQGRSEVGTGRAVTLSR